MEREPVDSSLMKSVGYDAATNTLEIETQKGDVYPKRGYCPASVRMSVSAAASRATRRDV